VFSAEGWNCATANAIRDLCGYTAAPIDGIVRRYMDDQWYAVFDVSDIDVSAYALWITWYKSRGRTEAMWLLSSGGEPRRPTAEECERIAAYYQPKALSAV
jgi:hypothetical protein